MPPSSNDILVNANAVLPMPVDDLNLDEELQKFANDFDRNKWLHIYKSREQPALCGFTPRGGPCSKPGCPNAVVNLEYCPVCGIQTCHFCRFLYLEMKKKK